MRPRLGSRGELRSTPLALAPSSSLQCGHGSGAVENRGARDTEGAVGVTSMRPRLGSRGEPGAPLGRLEILDPLALLQCGHGSGAVENKCAGMLAEHVGKLQCGHGSGAVENARDVHYAPGRARTSMRPRLGSRGERRNHGPGGSDVRGTSMRPRLGSRGEHGIRAWRLFVIKLQCGHGSGAVENTKKAAIC